MGKSLVAVAVAALLMAGEARAQEEPRSLSPVAIGTRVRIEAPTALGGRIQGMVIEIDERSLVLMQDERRTLVPLEAITRLEISTGKRRRALKGLIVGAGLGALVYGAMGASTMLADSHSEGALLGLGVGAAYGVGIGALVKTDRWSPVSLDRVHIGVAPTRGKGLGLALSLSF